MTDPAVRKRLTGYVEHPRFDETDLQILRHLQEDGRVSNAELARRVGMSPPSVLQRVRRLEDQGFIRRYTAVLDHQRMGFSLIVIAMVSLALHQEQPIEQFRKSAVQFPEVIECLHVSGDFDFMLKIVVTDMHAYERFVREKLSAIKGVGKIHSCFVLGSNKVTTALPI